MMCDNGSCDLIELSKLPCDACMSLVAMATKPGHTQVTISYKVVGVSLEASVTIAAYPPLKVCDDGSLICYCVAMVASGS